MKAAKDFDVVLNKEGTTRVSYRMGYPKDNIKIIKIKKGETIPKEFVKGLIERNIENVELEWKEHRPIIPPGLGVELPEPSKKMRIPKRKYTLESLTIISNEKGLSALKKIGAEFGVTDRSKNKLISEILREQEKRQREG